MPGGSVGGAAGVAVAKVAGCCGLRAVACLRCLRRETNRLIALSEGNNKSVIESFMGASTSSNNKSSHSLCIL